MCTTAIRSKHSYGSNVSTPTCIYRLIYTYDILEMKRFIIRFIPTYVYAHVCMFN